MEQHKDIGTRKDLCLYRIQTAKDNLKATKYYLWQKSIRVLITDPIMPFFKQ